MKLLIPLTLFSVGLGAVAVLSEPPREPPRGPYQAPLLPRLEMLRVVGAGQRSLVTDYYWLQAIQAAGRGGQSRENTRYLDLFYYSDLVTDLDPQFLKVYLYAGNTIPTNLGRETWVNTNEARKILEKGVKHFPKDSTLRLFLAYNLSYFHNEHAAAAEHLRIAASLPNANRYVPEMASRMLAFNRRFDAALALAESFRDSEQDPEMRQMFEERVQEIYRERVLIQVDDAIKAFQEREKRLPQSIGELVSKGDLPRAPQDPMGGVIYIAEDGRSSSTSSTLRLEPIDYRKKALEKEAKEAKEAASANQEAPNAP
ncbi:pilus assembly protein [Stigmatella sp. ncwal1]|uniref:Pilus assembly protein n=1 Tax=Stigmatella ashevillensis TaxID=2995309 RepID=A0ABT5D7Z3_9BACT|nr:pilus assembly protein [Stigmatella ashevillena]MDC0709785.1 pilus assembly protein [Stigmatella ashevillena]